MALVCSQILKNKNGHKVNPHYKDKFIEDLLQKNGLTYKTENKLLAIFS